MVDPLSHLLNSADGILPPVYCFDDVERWPAGAIDRLVKNGLLHQAATCLELFCHECGEMEDVVELTDYATQAKCAYTACPQHGLNKIAEERLGRWKTTFQQLMEAVFSTIAFAGEPEELVNDRVWRLGKAFFAGANRNVFFARGMNRRDARQVIRQANLNSRSVVFVPSRLPSDAEAQEIAPILLPLTTVLSWEDDRLRFDRDYVEAELGAALTDREATPLTTAGGSSDIRNPLVSALVRELQEHLKAASDHAIDTLKRTGTPKLLPRPSKAILARSVGFHASSVTRAFQEEKGRELTFLYDLAADLDRILNYAGCDR